MKNIMSETQPIFSPGPVYFGRNRFPPILALGLLLLSSEFSSHGYFSSPLGAPMNGAVTLQVLRQLSIWMTVLLLTSNLPASPGLIPGSPCGSNSASMETWQAIRITSEDFRQNKESGASTKSPCSGTPGSQPEVCTATPIFLYMSLLFGSWPAGCPEVALNGAGRTTWGHGWNLDILLIKDLQGSSWAIFPAQPCGFFCLFVFSKKFH